MKRLRISAKILLIKHKKLRISESIGGSAPETCDLLRHLIRVMEKQDLTNILNFLLLTIFENNFDNFDKCPQFLQCLQFVTI